jgi:hypothetical protein
MPAVKIRNKKKDKKRIDEGGRVVIAVVNTRASGN